MLAIPSALQAQFEEYLRNKAIPNSLQGAYKKWLRYYLDFCQKYHFPPIHKESLPPFIRKLQEKKQTKVQQEQAVMAITLYYEVLTAKVCPPQQRTYAPTHQSSEIRPFQRRKTLFYPRRIRPGRFNMKRSYRLFLMIPPHHQVCMAPHTPLASQVRLLLNRKT